MKCVISVIVLCVLMFHVSNTVRQITEVNGLCRHSRRHPGKCGPDRNKTCQVDKKIRYVRCNCADIFYEKKHQHDCFCTILEPCGDY
ncbi:hypothetical protein Bca4012_064999 [Brassica carinata]